jgi:hypothetical protein
MPTTFGSQELRLCLALIGVLSCCPPPLFPLPPSFFLTFEEIGFFPQNNLF